jgi:hypothetical protein
MPLFPASDSDAQLFGSDSVPFGAATFPTTTPTNGGLVGLSSGSVDSDALVLRAQALQAGRIDGTAGSPFLRDYAIAAGHSFADNGGGDYLGDRLTPLDDAFVYARDGLLYNQTPSLSDLAGSVALGPNGLLGNAPVGLATSDRLVRLAQPFVIEVPEFAGLRAEALAGLGAGSIVDMSRTWLNSVADVAAALPNGVGARRVLRLQNGGLNLPDGVELRDLVLIVERGDINFNGAGQRLRNVTLVAENGNVNLSGVDARTVSVLASGSIHMNREARFSGKNLLATENGNVIFDGATETVESKDYVKVVAHGGNIVFNAAANTRGGFWTDRNFIADQPSTLVGKIRAQQDVIFNAAIRVISDVAPQAVKAGVFTVGETGEVKLDFLFDGSPRNGQLALVSLQGMEGFEPGSQSFIREAAIRALSNSNLGHIVINDQTLGARFSGVLGTSD